MKPSQRSPETNFFPLWFIFSGTKMIVFESRDRAVSIPIGQDVERPPVPAIIRSYSIGNYRDRPCIAAEIPEETELPAGFSLHGIWGLHNVLDDDLFNLVLRAVHIINWSRQERFCPRCAEENRMKTDELAHECSSCGHITFPRISPAIIVLVEKGDEILLAQSPRFKNEFYSVLAGFVEAGETLEDTVKREVREETGIEVTDITYFGSQPWPFPDSLMIGFTATYAGGTLIADKSEIIAADWFDYRTLPAIPGRISIARRMIDAFIIRKRGALS